MNINNEKNENTPHCEEHGAPLHHCGCDHDCDADLDPETNLSNKQLEMELKFNPNFIKDHKEAQEAILKRYQEIKKEKKS